MPPKKKTAGKKQKKDTDAKLQQVDKTFYELEIADLNRKLARLRSEHQVLKDTNTEFQTKLENRDVDAGDIIEHLKRTSENAVKQLDEHKVKLTALQQAKDDQAADYKKQLDQANRDYRLMHQQLSNDKKLLSGKLNNLEEFRIVRDELMKKFSHQEKLVEEKEKQYQRIIYENERLHIVAKDRLKTEMEQRLYQLSTDFKRSAEMCIADTTKRVVRENIHINNELALMIETHRRLEAENKEFRERDEYLSMELRIESEEKDSLYHCKRISENVIKKLESRQEKLVTALKEAENHAKDAREAREQMRNAKLLKDNAEKKVRLLEQNLHAAACERSSMMQDAMTWMDERSRLRNCAKHARNAARSAITAYKRGADDLLDRLTKIVCLLNPAIAKTAGKRADSMETIPSLGVVYKKEVGEFIPVSAACKELALRTIEEEQSPSEGSHKSFRSLTRGIESFDEEFRGEGSEISLVSSEKTSDEYEGESSSETYYSVDFAGDPDTASIYTVSRSEYIEDEVKDVVRVSTSISEEASSVEGEYASEEEERVDKPEDENP